MRFLLTVVVPQRIRLEALELAVLELMAPFEFSDGRVETDSESDLDRRCPCAGTFATYMAERLAARLFPTEDSCTTLADICDRFLAQSRICTDLHVHCRPNPECVYCCGSGRYRDDFNPEPQFDEISYGWFRTGWIRGTPRSRELGDPHPSIDENYTTVPELIARHKANQDICTNSLLTPDGEWFSAGFSTWIDEAKFEAGFIDRLSRNPDCWAVGLECHR